MVEERPVCDSRYGYLHAGKRPVIRDGARVALRLAGVGLSRLICESAVSLRGGRVGPPAMPAQVDRVKMPSE